MATEKKVFTCFIASPSDVAEERAVCDEVVELINQSFGDALDILLKTVRWEKDAHPAIGTDGQAVINEQLHPENADFFIGIFWARFGCPTPRAGSGTEEEFERAYKQWMTAHSNRIQFYFKEADPPYANLNGEQFEKVKAFREKICSCGCLYQTFKSKEAFRKILIESLQKEILAMVKDSRTESEAERVQNCLDRELHDALSVFSDSNIVWIDRYICDPQKRPKTLAEFENKAVLIDTIVDSSDSFVISAPSQYGLTSAALHLRLVAWKKKMAWGYIDMNDLPSPSDVASVIQKDFPDHKIDCIIIDSWNSQKTFSTKIFEIIESNFQGTRLIVMHSYPEIGLLRDSGIRVVREWRMRELLPMPRQSVREAVVSRCVQVAGDENTVLSKLLSDMEMMNIPRTPINCWTLLKVAENQADQSPVNRTQLFDHLLFVLFNLFKLPTYGTLPNTNDCNRFLGSFCEKLIRESRISFTRREFIKHCSDYCEQILIDVDVEVVFNILFENKILIQTSSSEYRFVASFWIYYFAAKQMEQSDEFRDYILEGRRYANFPEIIEFYTGGTRDHGEILSLLDSELMKTREVMNQRLPFPKTLNPLKQLSWTSSPREVERMKAKLNEGMSNLPSCIKDQHADKTYNYFRPYDQSIQKYIDESLFFSFIQQVKSLSKALRNSDHSPREIKIQTIQHILSGWSEIAKVIFALSPVLAQTGRARWEGYGFFLDDSFDKDRGDVQKTFIKILQSCPHNVIRIVRDDLSSQRLGKLLYAVSDNLGEFVKHLLMIYLIEERPSGWELHIRSYINSLSGNSFYLFDVFSALGYVLQYEFPTQKDEVQIKQLAKECVGRHESTPTSRIPDSRITSGQKATEETKEKNNTCSSSDMEGEETDV